MSFDDGEHWQSLQLNLPHTSMRDLVVHDQDLIVATHGRSFWVLDDIGPLRAAWAPRAAVTLLKPSPAIRARRSTGTDTPIPPDEPSGRNPPNGAIIDYYLPQAAKGTVAIEVLDSNGAVLRRVSSTDSRRLQRGGARKGIDPPVLDAPAKGAGHDGRNASLRLGSALHGAARVRRGFPISAVPNDTPQEPLGPRVVPGVYRVRLEIGGHKWEQPLTVMPDPRVNIGQQDYAAQFALAQAIGRGAGCEQRQSSGNKGSARAD